MVKSDGTPLPPPYITVVLKTIKSPIIYKINTAEKLNFTSHMIQKGYIRANVKIEL